MSAPAKQMRATPAQEIAGGKTWSDGKRSGISVSRHTSDLYALIARYERGFAEIPYLLGFEDPNSFVRAFQTWSGSTPQAVRLAHSKGISS